MIFTQYQNNIGDDANTLRVENIQSGEVRRPIYLTAYDLMGSSVSIRRIFVYKKTLSEGLLLEGLKRAARIYPEMCGRVVSVNNSMPKIDCNDAGIEFSVRQSKMTFRDFLTTIYNQALYEDLVPTINKGKFEIDKNIPILHVTLTNYIDGGSVLGIVAPHIVVDGTGIFNFLKCWSDGLSGRNIEKAAHDLPVLQQITSDAAGKIMALTETKSKPKTQSGSFTSADHSVPLNHLDKLTEITFPIYSNHMTALKMLTSENTHKENQYVSSQDVVTAYVCKGIALGVSGSNSGEFVLRYIQNIRRYLDIEREGKYLRNAYIPVYISFSLTELCENEIHDIALQIRKSVKSLNLEKIRNEAEDVFRYFLQAPEEEEIEKNVLVGTSNWTKFPAYDLDFGSGKPLLFDTASAKTMLSNQFLDLSKLKYSRNFLVLPTPQGFPGWGLRLLLPTDELRKFVSWHKDQHLHYNNSEEILLNMCDLRESW